MLMVVVKPPGNGGGSSFPDVDQAIQVPLPSEEETPSF